MSFLRPIRSCLMAAAVLATCGLGCSDSETTEKAPPTVALYNLKADLSQTDQFYDRPLPSDLRLTADEQPDLSAFPNPQDNVLVNGLLKISQDRARWSTLPAGYFRFSSAMAPLDQTKVVMPTADAPYLLIDVDADGGELGRAYPAVATTLEEDDYTPSNLVAVASRPGFVLKPQRRYAFVLTDALRDAAGSAIVADAAYARLRDGQMPQDDAETALANNLEPLWNALDVVGVPRARTVAATVFTTGDAVADMAELANKVRDKHQVTIDDLAVDPDDGADHDRFCELLGTVSFPQFQGGTPPFDADGLFEIGADGVPVVQRQEIAPVVIALPKGQPGETMPAGGFPLVMYYHGSGGLAGQVIDRGKVLVPDGPTTKGEGPAHVLAAHGFATVGSAHPVNPERLPGASATAYLNFDNLSAFRDTFRQGVIEQRMYLDALLKLEIDPQTVASCTGLSLPAGETAFRFSADPVMAMGQSMGGMYTNMIGATEPRIKAVVPTGAGGLWSFFIVETTLVNGKGLLNLTMNTPKEVSYLHPALQLLEQGWEAAEPLVYMPRLGQRPLPDHPTRSVYEPVGKGDSYFPIQLYDAIVLAYGHQQAGDEVWPGMQESLSLANLDGIIQYPIVDNLASAASTPFTGVVVQYEGDGIYDPHAIYGQLDEVKHQYGCFFETFQSTGKAVVVAPAALGSPCQ